MGIVPEEHRMVQKDSSNEIRAINDIKMGNNDIKMGNNDIKMGNENKISP